MVQEPLAIRKRCCELCVLSYTETPHINTDNGLQIRFVEEGDILYIVFAGSNQRRDWLTNFRFFSKKFNKIKYHGGYLKTLSPHVEQIIKYADAVQKERIIITGHSAGGAWALILGVVSGLNPEQIVTFGAPKAIRKCDSSTQRYLNKRLTNYVNAYDTVTRLPYGWRKFGKNVVKWARKSFKSEHPAQVYLQEFFD